MEGKRTQGAGSTGYRQKQEGTKSGPGQWERAAAWAKQPAREEHQHQAWHSESKWQVAPRTEEGSLQSIQPPWGGDTVQKEPHRKAQKCVHKTVNS